MTVWYPLHKSNELEKLFFEQVSQGVPEFIKKWQVFFTQDGKNGGKVYHLIMVEPGKVDEGLFHINQVNGPLSAIEGFCYKVEPLIGMKDAIRLLGRT
jgi:hypothetical protein